MTAETPPGGWDRPVPGPPPLTAPYAGWWSRVGAALVDFVIVSVPVVVVAGLLLGGITAAFDADDGFGVFSAILGVLLYIAFFAAVMICYAPLLMRREGQHNGQTWGKQLVGIRVVRLNGVPMDFSWSALREVVVKGLALGIASSFIPLVPYMLNFLWPLWDDEKRALHDMVVDTRVVQA